MAKGSKLCSNLKASTSTVFINHFEGNCIAKVSFSNRQIPKTVNTLPADGKHYLLNRHNLIQPIQIQLSQKQKIFSKFFFVFLKSILNFKHLPKKDSPHSRCIS